MTGRSAIWRETVAEDSSSCEYDLSAIPNNPHAEKSATLH
jgi:hypothetical protein